MKFRSDFVTNSSSSSFVIAYNSVAEMTSDMEKFAKKYSGESEWTHQYKNVVYDMFDKRVSYEEAINMVRMIAEHNTWLIFAGNDYSDRFKEFGSQSSWFKSEECRQLCKKYIDEQEQKFRDTISPDGWCVVVSYSDSDGCYDVRDHLAKMISGVFCSENC